MRIFLAAELICSACALVQCTPRQFNSESGVKNATNGVTQVNPMAFNAFDIWRDGRDAEMLAYPQGYDDDSYQNQATRDGVFYVDRAEYWTPYKFTGDTTEGAKVVGDVLEYPVNNGRQLKLRFTEQSKNTMTQVVAMRQCKKQGLRLPSVRELFDFCSAGVTYDPNGSDRKYPESARCGHFDIWSASLEPVNTSLAWLFAGSYGHGNVGLNNRSEAYDSYRMRCVGPVEHSTPGVPRVNHEAFNAFNIWRDGNGAEILDYPQDYDDMENTIKPADQVFYVDKAEFIKDGKFVAVPTEGAKVVGDILEYPMRNGKQLKLRFTHMPHSAMGHPNAVAYCKNQGLRLPTWRELFDYCATGVGANYGLNYEDIPYFRYPAKARCKNLELWTASLDWHVRGTAWTFDGRNGDLAPNGRTDPAYYTKNSVRCVDLAD